MKYFILAFVLSFLPIKDGHTASTDVEDLLWPGEKTVVLAESKELVLYRVTEREDGCNALILQRNPSGEAMLLTDLSCEPMVTRATIVPSSIKGYSKIATFSGNEITGLMTVRD